MRTNHTIENELQIRRGRRMNQETRQDIIQNTGIFGNLSDSECSHIAEVAEEIDYKKGVTIFKENASADSFYLIISGKVDVVKEGAHGHDQILATKHEGEVFGEMSIIDDQPRSASTRAQTDVRLLKLSKKLFNSVLTKSPNISIEMSRNICKTVRETNSNYISHLEERNMELEHAYAKLKEMQNELIQVEKLSMVGKFASLIIHDIRNPMSNIRAYAELINMKADNNEKIVKSSHIIITEVDRLTKMTTELLEFSRGEISLNKKPVIFSKLISSYVETVAEQVKRKNVSISVTSECEAEVLVDKEKIKRVFLNLVNNSIDAILKEGEISIMVDEEKDWIKWTIKDNGVGMEPDILAKIFDPFFTYNKKKGTGLGMAIVKSIIESHNGTINSYSTKGAGTKFEVYLPKA